MKRLGAALILCVPSAAIASETARAENGLRAVAISDFQTIASPAPGVPVSADQIRAKGDPLDNCQAPDRSRGPRRRRASAVMSEPAATVEEAEDARDSIGMTTMPLIQPETEPGLFIEAARRPRRRRGAIPENPRRSNPGPVGSGRGASLRPIAAADLPEFQDDLDAASAALAARRTAAHWSARPAGQRVSFGGRAYTAAHLAKSFSALAELMERRPAPEVLRAELAQRFDLYRSAGPGAEGAGTVTGYFAPDLPIRETPGDWRVPILRSPGGTVSFSRREIAQGALNGRGLELYWTEHPADLLALQIEGSGWGVLPGGRRVLLASTGVNAYSFKSVSRALFACKITPRLLGPIELAAFLKSQTFEREQRMVDLNPRYVFFRAGEGGPQGAAEIELVAGRSIAIDPAQVPMAQAGLLFSKRPVSTPDGEISGARDFARLVFTHDTGDAIRGPARVDLFWGDGPEAEVEASHMMYPGRLFIFVLKTDTRS